MTGGACYAKGKERGVWYEVKVMVDSIKLKESQGKDASFERSLLKSWARRDAEYRKCINGYKL